MPSNKHSSRTRRLSTPVAPFGSKAARTSFAVVFHNQTGRIMRRYKYYVRGGISVPPEIIGVPKDMNSKANPGTVLVTSDNKEDSTDEDDDLDFLRLGPKAKLVYHWNDDDGTYNVDIQYNEKDGFKADLSGPDARKFTIRINQTGAANNGLEKAKPQNKSKSDHRRTMSFGRSGHSPRFNKFTERFRGVSPAGPSAGVAFLSVTVEKTSAEERQRQEDEEDEDMILQRAVAAHNGEHPVHSHPTYHHPMHHHPAHHHPVSHHLNYTRTI
ncbi:hypothetical protein H072_7605 [Dactylellina haptotyla CBS 200.50]|uniref:Uncharacterized protein n=1 Tax=Dactylellina haptotyla (strain CBS 200.50) TaxID=1284197 RepID=S8A6F6_DACHA|nr:hypothetical protein H072_7605 [Dactylellina haptotyla CBS 200.50]